MNPLEKMFAYGHEPRLGSIRLRPLIPEADIGELKDARSKADVFG